MDDELSYERRGDVLHVRFPAYETADEVRPHIDAALALAEGLGMRKALVDATASAIALSALDYTRVGQYLTRRTSANPLTMAIVRQPNLVTEARFLQQLLEGRAVRYRVFADPAEAEAWLREAPEP